MAFPTVRFDELGSPRTIVSTSTPSLRKTLMVPAVPSLGAASKLIDKTESVQTCDPPLPGATVIAKTLPASASEASISASDPTLLDPDGTTAPLVAFECCRIVLLHCLLNECRFPVSLFTKLSTAIIVSYLGYE